ncbi:hypothetical protein EHI8A_126530 [Entamoeba histolytica HM-1:IMSS-B]|uniref:Uncharacterized protein n=5 Tax=Entamoeba histolytica TaxID=5759 RepID=C4M4W0_ENTH1|nr:hypothetical protein EHI_028960 [Entamoeba histolytica HM-1:IMSS]EMH74347.1 hypothetical protein EHI8A_126530 [Entamoeba histolytica HM-1:IMSS-B]EMS11872.1 hypothetical protein KM1_118240 [Entamoeba histolytica HM-3:IMSS]ENY63102.1 hypothetical protein EHI7A_171190 [Entamoeba histolytica HM-1:IMSS-A]GAT96423.1 hypothetical protein CL6EHI_028960 [Entamoeba histolytica]EAL47279.2 hypothetical protein EHI_028960 [Entamoeba histolytica HM-1:IMSS]|eukprot:XP_652665.2 hypothetical protein EHI_028960 [Entamoeba histolytica HM-1:IMSS]
MNRIVHPLEKVFLKTIIQYFTDCSTILKFVFINKKCGEVPKMVKKNPFFLKKVERDCNSCVKFIREFKLFPYIDVLTLNCSYFRTFKTHQIMEQVKYIHINEILIKDINFLNGCESKIQELGIIIENETLNLKEFINLQKLFINIKGIITISSVLPNKKQKLELMKLDFMNNNLPSNISNELKEYSLINKIIITTNTKPIENNNNNKINFFYDGWIEKYETDFICKKIRFLLKRNEEGCDLSELKKVMKKYYPYEIKLNMKDTFNINWKYDLNELRMCKTYEEYFYKRHKGDHDFQDCIDEGYSVSEEYEKEKQMKLKKIDDEFNVEELVKEEINEYEDKKFKEETIKRREKKKEEAEKRRKYFPIIVKTTDIDLSEYTQLKNIETKSDIIGIKAPENYKDGMYLNFNNSNSHLSKRDEQKVFCSIRRNMDFSKESFINAKMIKCKLLQKTLFPSTLKRLTLEDCEVATYKNGSYFQLPKCVTSLTLKGNIDQRALHIERIPLIELQLLETPFVEINPFPQTLTKIKLMDINSSRLMNFKNCTLTSLELVSCVKAGFVLPNLRLFRGDNSNIYIKNIDSIKVRRCELFRCFVNDQDKLICDHLFSFGDICDNHNNPFFETYFEELPISKSVSSLNKSPQLNSSTLSLSTLSSSPPNTQIQPHQPKITPTNPFSRSAIDDSSFSIFNVRNELTSYQLPPPTNSNYYSPFTPSSLNYQGTYQHYHSTYSPSIPPK